MMSRRGYGRQRRRYGSRGAQSIRLVIQAPRGMLPRQVVAGQGARTRRRRRY